MQRVLLIFALIAEQLSGQQTIPYGDNPKAGEFIELNGARHYYEAYGTGSPLLLIHGNSTATKGWAPQIDYFSKKYRVYSLDCRGRGKSDLGVDSLTYLQQAKDAAQFIRKLKLDSVCIIGKSDGAIIAILLAIHYPQSVKKIVAFSANLQPDTLALYPETLSGIHTERVLAEKMLAANDTTKNWHLLKQCNRMMEFQPHISADDLQKIALPVLVISGDRDVIKEEHSFFIYRNIPRANLCILPNEKHGLPRIHPDLFNSTVDRYLEAGYKDRLYRFDK